MARKTPPRSPGKAKADDAPVVQRVRKLVEFDGQTLQALELLGRDGAKSLQALADEAFRDLLKKHGRPSSLKDALRQSARQMPANDGPSAPRKKPR